MGTCRPFVYILIGIVVFLCGLGIGVALGGLHGSSVFTTLRGSLETADRVNRAFASSRIDRAPEIAGPKGCVLLPNGGCQSGSVHVHPGLLFVATTQARLQERTVLADAFFTGSRLSFHAYGDGYGYGYRGIREKLRLVGDAWDLKLVHHEFSLLDQIRMGLRVIDLETRTVGDTAFVDESFVAGGSPPGQRKKKGNGHRQQQKRPDTSVRMCHSATGIGAVDGVLQLLGHGHDVLCQFATRALEDALREHLEWMETTPEGRQAFLIYRLGPQSEVDATLAVFRRVFDPVDRLARMSWGEMSSTPLAAVRGKVLVIGTGAGTGTSAAPSAGMTTVFVADVLAKHGPCQAYAGEYDAREPNELVFVHGDSISLAGFYYGSTERGALGAQDVIPRAMAECPHVRALLVEDFHSNVFRSVAQGGTGWTWDSANPALPFAAGACAVITRDGGHGAWNTETCTSRMQVLCRRAHVKDVLFISRDKVPWAQRMVACKDKNENGNGEAYAPTSPFYQAIALAELVKSGAQRAWIDYQV